MHMWANEVYMDLVLIRYMHLGVDLNVATPRKLTRHNVYYSIYYTIRIMFIQLKSFEDYFQAGFSVTFFSCQMMAFMPWSSRNQREKYFIYYSVEHKSV